MSASSLRAGTSPGTEAGTDDASHPSAWALQALVHPVSLSSVAVLWLNDEVLKALWPGWLSGKLSDMAGLVFFPLVLAALAGLARRSPKATIISSVLITGLWFTVAKTVPAVASATASLVTALSGRPAHITVDPTDLVALPALGWAVAAWRPPRAGATLSGPKFAVLIAAAFLSLATSTSCPERGPRDLTVVDGAIVADSMPSLESIDGGRTWRPIDDAPDHLTQVEAPVTKQACLPDDPSQCVQIDGTRIEESQDGGATWEPVWSYPRAQGRFISRFDERFGCGTYIVDAVDVLGAGTTRTRSPGRRV